MDDKPKTLLVLEGERPTKLEGEALHQHLATLTAPTPAERADKAARLYRHERYPVTPPPADDALTIDETVALIENPPPRRGHYEVSRAPSPVLMVEDDSEAREEAADAAEATRLLDENNKRMMQEFIDDAVAAREAQLANRARNLPCACGSGKKAKKCVGEHPLSAAERAAVERRFRAWSSPTRSRPELLQALMLINTLVMP